jgi:hypothetical protein
MECELCSKLRYSKNLMPIVIDSLTFYVCRDCVIKSIDGHGIVYWNCQGDILKDKHIISIVTKKLLSIFD